SPDEREYAHERLGERFLEALSDYDTQRRVEILVDSFLGEEKLRGKSALDVGTGLGFFAARLQQLGAVVTAVDIGPNLVTRVRETVGCECFCVDALSLTDFFGTERFDVVVSSECIEHTPDPNAALSQMAAVLKPGGYLAVSTPNKLWWPAVRGASVFKLRPFNGYENFSSFASLRATLRAADIDILEEMGLHLLPFQLPMHRLSRWCDQHLQFLRFLMINLCVLGRKRTGG
ncbi:MAG: class I SAM-dependent methyltransferase, partial [Armatimonadota bacterium]